MEEDLVIGFIKNYQYHQVHNWVFSLKSTGYKGSIVLVDYTPTDEMWNFCHQNSVSYKEYREPHSPARNICVDRFLDLHRILQDSLHLNIRYRYVITTDVRDVIFQRDPTHFLRNIDFGSHRTILFSGEGVTYANEPWSNNNMKQSFGNDAYDVIENREILNAGVLAGTHESLSTLALQIYLLCVGRPAFIPGGGGPDQSALNILTMNAGQEVLRTGHSWTWAAQIGTKLDPNKKFKNIDSPIGFDKEGYVYTTAGDSLNQKIYKFSIVHQYDRNPELKALVDERYAIG